jgi:hypothetical protein
MPLKQGLLGVWRTPQHAQASSVTSKFMCRINSEKVSYRNLCAGD